MNGISYLADTNALIYLLDGNECIRPFLNERLSLSIISEIEMLSYSEITNEENIKVKSLISDCEVINLDNNIKEITISLRRKYRIKLPDAIIAATAIDGNMTLITADKGFEKIDELSIELLAP